MQPMRVSVDSCVIRGAVQLYLNHLSFTLFQTLNYETIDPYSATTQILDCLKVQDYIDYHKAVKNRHA